VSAHCHKCGNDLVYAGEYPNMECPVCTLKADPFLRYKDAIVKTLRYIDTNIESGDHNEDIAIQVKDLLERLGEK
jgi:hypothetical protein